MMYEGMTLTVAELKEILKNHNDNEVVWCAGGEDGCGEWSQFGIGEKVYIDN